MQTLNKRKPSGHISIRQSRFKDQEGHQERGGAFLVIKGPTLPPKPHRLSSLHVLPTSFQALGAQTGGTNRINRHISSVCWRVFSIMDRKVGRLRTPGGTGQRRAVQCLKHLGSLTMPHCQQQESHRTQQVHLWACTRKD